MTVKPQFTGHPKEKELGPVNRGVQQIEVQFVHRLTHKA